MTTKVSLNIQLSNIEIPLKDISLERINKIHEFIMQDDSDWIDEFYDHVSEVVTEQIKKVYPNIIIGMGEKDDLEEICDISTTLDRNDILNFINLHVPCCDKTKMKIPGAKFCSQCGTAL